MARPPPANAVDGLKRQGAQVSAIRAAMLRLMPVIWPELMAIRAQFGFAATIDLLISLTKSLGATLAHEAALDEDRLLERIGKVIAKPGGLRETVPKKGARD